MRHIKFLYFQNLCFKILFTKFWFLKNWKIMKNCKKRGTFDFLNPQFASLYHTPPIGWFSIQDGFFLVTKTVLLEEFLYNIAWILELPFEKLCLQYVTNNNKYLVTPYLNTIQMTLIFRTTTALVACLHVCGTGKYVN